MKTQTTDYQGITIKNKGNVKYVKSSINSLTKNNNKMNNLTINQKINLRANLIPYYGRSYGNLTKASIRVNKLILMGISFK